MKPPLPFGRSLSESHKRGGFVTRRKSIRFELRIPAIFRWRDHGGEHERGGFTRDVSVKGVFIATPICPPKASELKLDLLLPALDGAAPGLKLEGEGLIIRVENGIGFAVATDFSTERTEMLSLQDETTS